MTRLGFVVLVSLLMTGCATIGGPCPYLTEAIYAATEAAQSGEFTQMQTQRLVEGGVQSLFTDGCHP